MRLCGLAQHLQWSCKCYCLGTLRLEQGLIASNFDLLEGRPYGIVHAEVSLCSISQLPALSEPTVYVQRDLESER